MACLTRTRLLLGEAVYPDQKTLRGGGFITSTDTLFKAFHPSSQKCIPTISDLSASSFQLLGLVISHVKELHGSHCFMKVIVHCNQAMSQSSF